MKQKIIEILTALITIARADPEDKRVIQEQKKKIAEQQAEIDTLHGDDPLNDPEVKSLVDQAQEVLASSQPADEHLLEDSGPSDEAEDEDQDQDQTSGESESESESEKQ